MIEVKNLTKTYSQGNHHTICALDQLSFQIKQGEWLSVTGPSGSGKSTLLALLAGLDLPSGGDVLINGTSLAGLGEDDRAEFRAKNMGFVFQFFRLMPYLNALENVRLPLELLGHDDSHEKATGMLERVGLAKRGKHLPSELSGGEQQRVAIARAFVCKPKILFGDEPTGNLDSKSGKVILDLLSEIHREENTTLVIVTHDEKVAKLGQQQLILADGKKV